MVANHLLHSKYMELGKQDTGSICIQAVICHNLNINLKYSCDILNICDYYDTLNEMCPCFAYIFDL